MRRWGSIAGIETRSGNRRLTSASATSLSVALLPVGVGRSLWDRAVDALAWQDVPAWKGVGLGVCRGRFGAFGGLSKSRRGPYVAAAGNEEGCGLIACGQVYRI
jgi:hypothetical protein